MLMLTYEVYTNNAVLSRHISCVKILKYGITGLMIHQINAIQKQIIKVRGYRQDGYQEKQVSIQQRNAV